MTPSTTEIGDAGSRRAAHLLSIAVCGEVSNSSMSEDAAKVDLHLTFRHAFRPKELIPLRCQVKSGSSYGRKTNNHISLSIDDDTKRALSGTGTPGLILWVPAAPAGRVYWYTSDPRNMKRMATKIALNDYVRPSLRYDLSRLATYSTWSHRHACQTIKKVSEDEMLSVAKQHYSRLKSVKISHPLVGELKVSRQECLQTPHSVARAPQE